MATQTSGKKSNAGNYYLIFLGLLLMFMGSGFTLLMWLSFSKANATRQWMETPCLIVKSEKVSRSGENMKVEYQWLGEYAYAYNGETYVGSKLEPRGARWSAKIEKTDDVLASFPEGSASVCYVNPENPVKAILKHDSRGAGYSIWFPMIFAVGGGGMIFGAIKKWNRKP